MRSATSRTAAASSNKADEEVVDVEAAIVAAGMEDPQDQEIWSVVQRFFH